MNDRHLEFFAAVVRRGTFSGASTETGVTQSALSQAIAALESELGAMLFERSTMGVRLTAAGREFAIHAADALVALDRARDAVTRVNRVEGGRLDVACPASLGIDPMPRLLAAFSNECPGVSIRVHNVPEQPIEARQLFDLGADVLVTLAEFIGQDMHTERLAPMELLAVLPDSSTSSNPRQAVPLQTVLTHGLVTPPSDTAAYRLVVSRLGQDALERSIAVEVVHAEGVLPLVLAGAGATILPAGHARVASAMPGLVECDLDPPALLEVAAAIPRDSGSVAAHRFLRVCREVANAA
ncbi:LysR family transcriptional regulator [Aeromicrobium duanguangcaii]|uniref:LysR family transcriptional regulator n=1 Tax=Aeromicrobium duanguangcaii TaxID=2968086 RepID=A0ABY5KHD8_9ACTN|nr:LysR family transcriptional regulator [Aeromicrobium duanguangcaii]MCD9153144.1 LysR family transcriptional regulator [Aeromicrobium duanguangcaii]UUI69755.1 LysR family transcriptional regulator [Aeromicrobium duanguangcaii]